MAARDSFTIMPREEAFSVVRKFKTHLEKMGVVVQKMYIYGSYAKGSPRYGSDIDICVISPSFQDKFESNMLLRREAIKFDSRIEPVAYAPEKFEDWIPLAWEIKRSGVEVN